MHKKMNSIDKSRTHNRTYRDKDIKNQIMICSQKKYGMKVLLIKDKRFKNIFKHVSLSCKYIRRKPSLLSKEKEKIYILVIQIVRREI